MAIEEVTKKRSLPAIPEKVWWAFRARMTASIPSKIGPEYLESALAMSESSAMKIFRYLATLGLVTEEYSATDLLKEWRLDDSYESACRKIIAAVYPTDLQDIAPGPIVDRAAAKRWFMKSGLGEAQATQSSAMYSLISEADVAKAGVAKSAKPRNNTPTNGKHKINPKKVDNKAYTSQEDDSHGQSSEFTSDVPKVDLPKPVLQTGGPTVHLNLQIHISPDLSPEQIEKVFESMGKHIFSRG